MTGISRFGLLVAVAAVAACGQESDTAEPLSEATLQNVNVVAYANHCKAELGLPEDIVLAPMNCLDGVEVPFTVGGMAPDADTYAALEAGQVGCDNPSWFPELPCYNYNFVQRRQLSDDVVAVLLCRMRTHSGPGTMAERRAAYAESLSEDEARTLYEFDSLGLIWTNTDTGRTCFFDQVQPVYGGYLPSPDDPEPPRFEDLPDPKPPEGMRDAPGREWWEQGAADAWHPPAITAMFGGCVSCHDAEPFVRTPWVADLGVLPAQDPTTPYVVLGDIFESWVLHERPTISTAPVTLPDGSQEPQLCTSCHRMGGNWGCSVRADWYTAHAELPGVHDDVAGFQQRALMPPPGADFANLPGEDAETWWLERFGAHYDALQCCCEDPTAVGCVTQDIFRDPLPEPVKGTGPAACLPL